LAGASMVRLTKTLPTQLSTGGERGRSQVRHRTTTQATRLPPSNSLLASSSAAASVTPPGRRLQARQLQTRQPAWKRRLIRVKSAEPASDREPECGKLLSRDVGSSTCLCRRIEPWYLRP